MTQLTQIDGYRRISGTSSPKVVHIYMSSAYSIDGADICNDICYDREDDYLYGSYGKPMLAVLDIQSIADVTHAHGAKLLIDNTFANPIVCQILKHGADFVIYSATEFMSDYSDIMAGIVILLE